MARIGVVSLLANTSINYSVKMVKKLLNINVKLLTNNCIHNKIQKCSWDVITNRVDYWQGDIYCVVEQEPEIAIGPGIPDFLTGNFHITIFITYGLIKIRVWVYGNNFNVEVSSLQFGIRSYSSNDQMLSISGINSNFTDSRIPMSFTDPFEAIAYMQKM